jgi:hypothetical protein
VEEDPRGELSIGAKKGKHRPHAREVRRSRVKRMDRFAFASACDTTRTDLKSLTNACHQAWTFDPICRQHGATSPLPMQQVFVALWESHLGRIPNS